MTTSIHNFVRTPAIRRMLAHWPKYMMGCTKARYQDGFNQCDGCMAAIPTDGRGNHVIPHDGEHVDPIWNGKKA